MGDSSPLLSDSDSIRSSESLPPPARKPPAATLDDAIERYIGGSGKAQLSQAILVSFAWFFDAQQTFISIFADADPKWHCTAASPACSSASTTVCRLPAGSWAWDWPINASIISEWALQCSGPVISGLPSSAFFMGCLLGGLVLSSLADSSLGRKNTLILSCLVMSLASLLLAVFSTNVWIYSGFKFVVGFGRAAIGSCALVLPTEIVSRRWRSRVGILGSLFFTLGFLSLPAIAYLNRGSSWRVLYLWASLPAFLYCALIHLVVHESPRWLLIRGRKEEAAATLRSIADRSSLTLSFIDLPSTEGAERSVDSALKVLLRKGWALRRLITVMVVGLGLGMAYYAMPLAVGDLAFEDLYLSVAFNALAEIPASVATFLLIGRMNRRTLLLVFCLMSGACSCVCAFMGGWRWVQVGMELVSFFSACTAFNVVMIYMVELFPTSVRNSALSVVRQALVFGGVVGPAVVAVGRRSGNGSVSFGIFGAVIAFCGAFAAVLPETHGRALCDTLDEEEQQSGNYVAARRDDVADDV